CLDHLARARGWRREDVTVAVQGYGNAGSWLAILLQDMGYRVVAVSDSKGTIHAPEGLVPAEVLTHKQETGSVVGFPGAASLDSEAIIGLDCDVLALAALEESLREDNAGTVRATTILETANYPVTPEAEAALLDRGVTLVPDILASGGGVAVSYLEWVQDLQRRAWTEERVNTNLTEIMDAATEQVLHRADLEASSLREAAYLIALERVTQAEVARGFR
ncbi:MAG TPA: glutamate dehydrogenase, partial [Actinomycetota bacterium]